MIDTTFCQAGKRMKRTKWLIETLYYPTIWPQYYNLKWNSSQEYHILLYVNVKLLS